jgi:hypothetical protein
MDLATTVYAVTVILLAAIVRGFTGFGFSIISISALTLAVSPVEVIASIFLMEIAASLHLLPGVWREIRWRPVAILLAGAAIGTPLGVHLLASVPEPVMQIALASLVLVATSLIAGGFALERMPGPLATGATGLAGGLLNGAFGIGGPPFILFFFSSPAGAAAGRASLIALFLGVDVIGLAVQGAASLLTLDHLWRAAFLLPALLLGVTIGSRSFRNVDEGSFRKAVYGVLVLMASAIGIKGVLALLPA